MLMQSHLSTREYTARLFFDQNGMLHFELARGDDRLLIPVNDLEGLKPEEKKILQDALRLMVRRSPVVGIWLRKHGYEHLLDFPFELAGPLETVSKE